MFDFEDLKDEHCTPSNSPMSKHLATTSIDTDAGSKANIPDSLEEREPEDANACRTPIAEEAASVSKPPKEHMPAEGTLDAPLETPGSQVESADGLKGVVEAQCTSDEKALVEKPAVAAETAREVSESMATPDVAEESADAKAAAQAESVEVNEVADACDDAQDAVHDGMAAIGSAAAKNITDDVHEGALVVASAVPIAGMDAIASGAAALAPTAQAGVCDRCGCQVL